MNTWVRVILYTAAALLVSAGIAWIVWYSQPISGDITTRQFIPAHMEWRSRQSCSTHTTTVVVNGKSQTRSTTTCISIPYQTYVPDWWGVRVCNEERCKWVSVSQVVFEDSQVGQYFSEEN